MNDRNCYQSDGSCNSGRIIGVIDIGSNAVRMVVYDCSVMPPLQIFNEKVFCALGKNLATTNTLYPEGVRKAFKTLQGFSYLAEAQQIPELIVTGTEALRRADDAASFIEDIRQQLSLNIRVLSGDEEAHYAALGVLSLDPAACGVVADYGGGSLELALIQQQKITQTISLPLGGLRLTQQPDITAYAEQYLASLPDDMRGVESVYIIGGSWRSLAESYMRSVGMTRALMQGHVLPANEIASFCAMIKNLSVHDLMQRYKLEERRAVLMPVSAEMLQLLIHAVMPRSIVVSTAGLRDGLVLEAMGYA